MLFYEEDLWSAEATFLCPQWKGLDFTREMRLQSTDQQAAVHVLKEEWWLELGGQKISPEEPRVTADAEFAWSPDGKAFYITQSENVAEVQGFHTEAYAIDQGHLKRLADVNEIVQREFDRHHECADESVAAVKWVGDSNHLLMVAETPWDSNCERGYFAGYLISLDSGTVIHRYTSREFMRTWNGVIGNRLKDDFRSLKIKQKNAAP